MARDANGTYTLPLADVQPDTTVESSWANDTLHDVRDEFSDSLSRAGKGGMSAPLKLFSGTVSLPGLSFSAELDSGFYRAANGDVRMSVSGVDQMRWRNNQADIWNDATSMWEKILTLNSIGFSLETQTLAAGQLAVVFVNDVSTSAFFVNGDDVDNGRLAVTADYTYDQSTKTLTLTQSYPAGTTISAQRISGADVTALGGVAVYSTLSAMLSGDLSPGDLAQTIGEVSEGDGGGRTHRILLPTSVDNVNTHLLSNGNVASVLYDGTENGIAADAGSIQGTATQLTMDYSVVTVAATAGDGVKLPPAAAGRVIVIKNNSAQANSIDIFPFLGDNIDSLALNDPDPLGAGASVAYVALSDSNWQKVSESSVASSSTELGQQVPMVDSTPFGSIPSGTKEFTLILEDIVPRSTPNWAVSLAVGASAPTSDARGNTNARLGFSTSNHNTWVVGNMQIPRLSANSLSGHFNYKRLPDSIVTSVKGAGWFGYQVDYLLIGDTDENYAIEGTGIIYVDDEPDGIFIDGLTSGVAARLFSY